MMLSLVVLGMLSGCSPCDESPGCLAAEDLPGGLLSVRTVTPEDVWLTGASADPSDGAGPAAVHYDGEQFTHLDTSAYDGHELWWSWPTETEVVFVGDGGLILELDRASGTLSEVTGPESDVTFFGVWGASAADVWAVGETSNGPPALWRRVDGEWAAFDGEAPRLTEEGQPYFKVHGTAADDMWIVGGNGLAMHWDGTAFTETPTTESSESSFSPLLTVDAGGERPVAVGGLGNAVVLEYDGTAWRDVSPDFQPGYNGVCTGAGQAWAVGLNGSRSHRTDTGWVSDATNAVVPVTTRDWHGCALDTAGNLWTVGGRISTRPLVQGVLGYQGEGSLPPF